MVSHHPAKFGGCKVVEIRHLLWLKGKIPIAKPFAIHANAIN